MTEKETKVMNVALIGSSIGLVAGLGYAFRTKRSFWGYVGFGLLGSVMGSAIAGIPARILIKEKNSSEAEYSDKLIKQSEMNHQIASNILEAIKAKTKEHATTKQTVESNKKFFAEIDTLEKSLEKLGWKVVSGEKGELKLGRA